MGPKELLQMAKDLDQMTKDVLPEEADVLEETLKRLLAKKQVPQALSDSVIKMHEKYLSPKSEEEPLTDEEMETADSEDEEIEE